MIINKTSKNSNLNGFTIVELLIVVVIIAILAAITIVAYNGITNRAKSSATQALVTSFKKKVELFNANTPYGYPIGPGDLTGILPIWKSNNTQTTQTSDPWYVPAGTFKGNSYEDPTAENGQTTIRYQACGPYVYGLNAPGLTSVDGAKFTWWDYSKSSNQLTVTSVGNTTEVPGSYGCLVYG